MDELEKIRERKMKELKEKLKKGKETETKIEVNGGNFQEKVIQKSNQTPVVVDFWAPWCTPCQTLGPILEKLAEEHQGRFILAKLNVSENSQTSKQYAVMSIPAVKLFKNGRVAGEFIGALPESAVKQWLDKNL